MMTTTQKRAMFGEVEAIKATLTAARQAAGGYESPAGWVKIESDGCHTTTAPKGAAPVASVLPDSRANASAAVSVMAALAEAIRALGSVPSGTLYAQVMGSLSLDQYRVALDILTGAGLVRVKSDEITWIGPHR